MRHLAGFFPATEYEQVMVGLGEPDDAAVYRLDETRALITTTDFFTPIVDDPWTWGAIAAANAMSDVYAMGGEVLFCLNVAGFPARMGAESITQVFTGGAYKVKQAGAAIAGGHTVNSPEPFYGLSVTGMVHPDNVMRKGGARAGDALFLTKPLGTGVITTAAKLVGPGAGALGRQWRLRRGKPRLRKSDLDAAVISMLHLNRCAAQAAQAADVRSATDITGFGLLGHGSEMALAAGRETGVGLRIFAGAVPVLPGAFDYIQGGYLTRGSERNPASFGKQVRFEPDVTPEQRTLLWEAETSGGLLIAVPAANVERFIAACGEHGQAAWPIGEVVAGIEGIEVTAEA
ncbi:MAG: selenide, water dikinase SelD [Caldilineaceae bacterium]|nr:selenide, water dikinase SelD [Caldilineaceae bacterium]